MGTAAIASLGIATSLFAIVTIVRSRRERATITDLTAALHDAQARYRALVDRAEGIFLVDAATKRVIECNAALRALLGYDADEAARLTLYDLDKDAPEAVDAMIRQLSDLGRPLQLERRYRHK